MERGLCSRRCRSQKLAFAGQQPLAKDSFVRLPARALCEIARVVDQDVFDKVRMVDEETRN